MRHSKVAWLPIHCGRKTWHVLKCAGIAQSFCAVYTYILLDRSLLLAVVGYHTTVTVVSVLLSLVLTLSLSTCAVTELRGGELCSTPQLSQSLLWSRAADSLHAGGGDSVKAGTEGRGHQQGTLNECKCVCIWVTIAGPTNYKQTRAWSSRYVCL